MGHIRLSREADAIIICPLSADLMAKMAAGIADDLASTVLLASDKPIFAAPAMNVRMWENPVTEMNYHRLKENGIHFIDPVMGDMACGEYGMGKLNEVEVICDGILNYFSLPKTAIQTKKLLGKSAIVTAGPTIEAIDMVRYIGNHSSGKQAYEIARALRNAGASVTLVSGPVQQPELLGVNMVHVQSADEMLGGVLAHLPCDIFVAAAAVADWRVKNIFQGKIKKTSEKNTSPPKLELIENVDILKTIANDKSRPAIVVGFAAESDNLLENATKKRKQKKCDMLFANKIFHDNEQGQQKSVFGSDENQLLYVDENTQETLPHATKKMNGDMVVEKIINFLEKKNKGGNNDQ